MGVSSSSYRLISHNLIGELYCNNIISYLYRYFNYFYGFSLMLTKNGIEFYLSLKYRMFFPLPSRLISPLATNFRSAPSIELMLNEGHNSLISCFENLPILFIVARRTVSSAGNFVSTSANLSSKSL